MSDDIDPLVVRELVAGEVLTPHRCNTATVNDRLRRIHVAIHLRPRDPFKNEKRAEARAAMTDLVRHILWHERERLDAVATK